MSASRREASTAPNPGPKSFDYNRVSQENLAETSSQWSNTLREPNPTNPAPMTPLATPSRPRKWRRFAWYGLLFLIVACGVLLWWRPWRPWDVSIKFLHFEDRKGARVAVFEVQNRSSETLLVPNEPNFPFYQLFSSGGKSTHGAHLAGGWMGLNPGKSMEITAPLLCADGTSVGDPFRIGVVLSNLQGTNRRQSLEKLPGWAAHWVLKGVPQGYLTNKRELFWSEKVTP